ncbi:hypothetical protein CAOG_08374 [Capsaspora owczarzaki ATCC 30864]|uniref:hypothetical protein n=1 Tax=Capsaspora owczarzaki (strain ATCC 30864) TaxID=595528 RepID=UPI0001FE309A|nr:hypothetical protein CAOG_08374 [Capsaspora owczarzaki ATCC 30864]|eukprot:XP_004359694.1 hypothetical protein CAOG_08374 [Capsaspora owczarzaki ATCC 30864]
MQRSSSSSNSRLVPPARTAPRIGALFEAYIPKLKPELDSMTLHLSKAPALLWKPPPDTSEDTLESVEAALEQIVRETKLHIAHALAVLMYNDYDEAKALREASTLVMLHGQQGNNVNSRAQYYNSGSISKLTKNCFQNEQFMRLSPTITPGELPNDRQNS